MPTGTVYLIPTFLHEDAIHTLPNNIAEAVQQCTVFFVEQEKTARRFLKKIWPQIIIDNYQWYTIHKAENKVLTQFKLLLQQGKNIGIISEAGCPAIADPGEILVATAQQLNATIKPLVGPNSIILALMASGMNGNSFQFHGYLPIDSLERKNKIKALELESKKTKGTQIFIETPYRNNQLIKNILDDCLSTTKLCIAIDITAPTETIQTKTIGEWKKININFHKRLGIFLILAS